ncbi:MAG: hypothetical protein U0575_05565 [Phycisphaerales bacterium]
MGILAGVTFLAAATAASCLSGLAPSKLAGGFAEGLAGGVATGHNTAHAGGTSTATAPANPAATSEHTPNTIEDASDVAGASGSVDAPRHADAANTRFSLDPLLRGVARTLGMPAPPTTRWSLDLQPLLQALGLVNLGKSTGGIVSLGVEDGGVSMRFDPSAIGRAWHGALEAMDSLWKDGTEQLAMLPVWGLRFLDGDEPSRLPRGDAMPDRVVVLVHGLDDPGWIWDQLAPALRASGQCAVAFEYPNDGPIAASADFFGEAMTKLRTDGVRHVDIVTHSMGGLVVRDTLTRDAWYAGDGRSADGRLPSVDRVILVAPPNHGAAIATLQPLSEVKDQAIRFLRGTARWNGAALDGHGEAARDLQPDSAFLADLNSRPMPRGVRFTIIEGCLASTPASTGTSGDPIACRDGGAAPDALHDPAGAARAFCRTATVDVERTVSSWIGDGLVTTDSSRLDGVDDVVVVRGNHQSVLRTWVPGRVAPAIPVIVDRLRQR